MVKRLRTVKRDFANLYPAVFIEEIIGLNSIPVLWTFGKQYIILGIEPGVYK